MLFTHVASAALKLELVASGFSDPVFATAPPADENRLFVLEQHTGRIRILDLSSRQIQSVPFLIVTNLATGSEQGLLGMAFHPGFQTNGHFYINMTARGSGRTEIHRYTASGDPATATTADRSSQKVILTFAQPESNHNGGWMGFGLDGYLYISTGDGGGGNDLHGAIGNGQNRASLLGKILRIDVDNGDPYSIPDGNPFKGSLSMTNEIWAFGLRNPWRCSFDRATGDLWIGDVGQSSREEIDIIPAGVAGLNFGWRPREGDIQNPAFANEQPVTPAIDPVFAYPRSDGICVTGGYVYRGGSIPELQGKYIFADYGTANFWLVTPNGTNGTTELITSQIDPAPRRVNNPSSFGEDAAGELYVCDLRDGQLFRIISDAPPGTEIQTLELSESGEEFIFSFSAAAGQSYIIEEKTSFSETVSWETALEVPAPESDETVTITNQVTGRERYFRIRLP